VQALKELIRRVPKDCIALIHRIELDICLVRFYNRHRNFHRVRKEDISQLEMVSRALAKYFKGLEQCVKGLFKLFKLFMNIHE
jgi:hypothetical protein